MTTRRIDWTCAEGVRRNDGFVQLHGRQDRNPDPDLELDTGTTGNLYRFSLAILPIFCYKTMI
ncbi:MAG TPA: hypothetical protein DDY14_11945 [Chromatiaceae bacterium]|nr:MAG: hypothetical protein N838_26640 [Thiohalocapsa sp. PB-PSB1]HBG95992.1 hypothetical protein [Chromatiaceae bacterium]